MPEVHVLARAVSTGGNAAAIAGLAGETRTRADGRMSEQSLDVWKRSSEEGRCDGVWVLLDHIEKRIGGREGRR